MINVKNKNLLFKQQPCISQLPSTVNFHKDITLMKLFELLNILEKNSTQFWGSTSFTFSQIYDNTKLLVLHSSKPQNLGNFGTFLTLRSAKSNFRCIFHCPYLFQGREYGNSSWPDYHKIIHICQTRPTKYIISSTLEWRKNKHI